MASPAAFTQADQGLDRTFAEGRLPSNREAAIVLKAPSRISLALARFRHSTRGDHRSGEPQARGGADLFPEAPGQVMLRRPPHLSEVVKALTYRKEPRITQIEPDHGTITHISELVLD